MNTFSVYDTAKYKLVSEMEQPKKYLTHRPDGSIDVFDKDENILFTTSVEEIRDALILMRNTDWAAIQQAFPK